MSANIAYSYLNRRLGTNAYSSNLCAITRGQQLVCINACSIDALAITRATNASCCNAIWDITVGPNEPGLTRRGNNEPARTRATYASYISELWNNNTEPKKDEMGLGLSELR